MKNLNFYRRIVGINALIFIILINTSCENNKYDKNGFKDGDWTEYLDLSFKKEVPKDSASFYRKITYKNGYPVGLVQDFFAKSGKLQGEEYLISGPYSKEGKRPEDKSEGLSKWFDEKTGSIINWEYKDEFNNYDFKKYYLTGLNEISKDKRFNKDFYISNKKYSQDDIKLFKRYENNPALYDEDIRNINTNIYSNPELVALLKDDKSGLLYQVGLLMGLKKLVGDSEENNNTSDNNSSIENNEYSSSGNESHSSSSPINPSHKQCYKCKGSGKCSTCMKPFRVHYWSGYGWKSANQTRPGQVMCSTCDGSGLIYGIAPIGSGDPPSKKCYISACNGGWINCSECNYNGDGENLGECERCDGTGTER